MPMILHSSPVKRPKQSQAAEIPSWITTAISNGWVVGQWLRISGDGSTAIATPTSGYGLTNTNNVRSVKTVNQSDTDLRGQTDSWVGGALATGLGTHGSMMIGLGGGHGTYNGPNDVFAFDLDTRTWREIANSTFGVGQDATAESYGEYNDGSPVNSHTAHWPFYDSLRNEYVIPKGWKESIQGSDQVTNNVQYGHALNLTAAAVSYSPSQWTRLDWNGFVDADENLGMCQQCGGAWHDGKFWFWAQASTAQAVLGSYDSATRAYTNHSSAWPNNAYQGGAGINAAYVVDPVRNVLLVAQYRYGAVTMLYNLSAPSTYNSANYTAWSAVNSGTTPATNVGMGMDWSPALQAFVAWNQGLNVFKATPSPATPTFTSGVDTDYTLLWAEMAAVDAVVPVPYGNNNGTFNRFRVASFGGYDIAFVVTHVDGAVSAFRIT